MGVGPYPSAQGAEWGPEGRKIRVISYMGAEMASFLCGFLFIYNGWGWGYQGLCPTARQPPEYRPFYALTDELPPSSRRKNLQT